MSDIVIKAEGLGKSYLIGHNKPKEQYSTLRDAAATSVKSFLKKSGELFKGNSMVSGDVIEEFWALKGIDFEIKQGDAVGIIGRNGAGKSTLLKVLSRITEPSEGKVTIKGRVASLLEVGTGFHPELSGRDNIFLNGAILGMSRIEIRRKFDEIVDFAGVDKFLDTPVKRYSSGMYVRLAFAVAAYLEPEILIIDEVLAVGDVEFQKKCLGKMDDVSKKEGRTVLFVSHNTIAINALCNKAIVLNSGKVDLIGSASEGVAHYHELASKSKISVNQSLGDRKDRSSGAVRFSDLYATDSDRNLKWIFTDNEDLFITFKVSTFEAVDGALVYLAFLSSLSQEIVTNTKHLITNARITSGENLEFSIKIPGNTLRTGQYDLYAAIGKPNSTFWYDIIDSNVGLPSLNIIPSTEDPHKNAGFFNMTSELITI